MNSSRLPPPQGAPPSYGFVTQVYRRNLRPVVMMIAFLSAFWSLISAIGYFRNFGVDKSQNVPRIASLSLALGAVYMVVFVIEVFGVYCAVSQRVSLVRLYALLSGLSALIVIGSGLVRIVTHFVWKNDIINECTNLSKDKTIVWFGFWGPINHEAVTPQEASAWCRDSWDHDSWALVVAFLILSVLAIFFSILAFSYWRQLLDPTSSANAARAPSAQVRTGGFPSHYTPAYNTNYPDYVSSVPNLPYQPYDQRYGYTEHDDPFAPPYEVDGKPPGYTGAGTAGDFKGENKSTDAFVNSDGQSLREERDVTSGRGTSH